MTIFIVIAEIGTKGWATTDCSCKALSGCSLCTGRASGGEGHNCRARRDQATGFAANILNREQKSGEEIANHPAKLQCALKEWCLQWQRRFWKSKKPGGNKRTCFKGYFAVALSFCCWQCVIQGQWFFQGFLSICHNKCEVFAFILEAICFSRAGYCQLWHIYLNIQAALTKLPEDVVYVKQSCNSPSGGI